MGWGGRSAAAVLSGGAVHAARCGDAATRIPLLIQNQSVLPPLGDIDGAVPCCSLPQDLLDGIYKRPHVSGPSPVRQLKSLFIGE
jgi:hypothetical protein